MRFHSNNSSKPLFTKFICYSLVSIIRAHGCTSLPYIISANQLLITCEYGV